MDGTNASIGAPHSKSDAAWENMNCCTCNKSRMISISIGFALAAIAAVAAYYSIVHGLSMLDASMYGSASSYYGAYALLYMGAAYATVAVGNVFYSTFRQMCHNDESGADFEYTPWHAKMQIGISILAPIAIIPGLLFGAASLVLARPRR